MSLTVIANILFLAFVTCCLSGITWGLIQYRISINKLGFESLRKL